MARPHLRARTNHTCHQKPNPSREIVSLTLFCLAKQPIDKLVVHWSVSDVDAHAQFTPGMLRRILRTFSSTSWGSGPPPQASSAASRSCRPEVGREVDFMDRK
jgi:hypothetical protein